MPLYEYECPKDGRFEKIQKFSDPPLGACPTCGGPIEKLLSAPAIQFKGTGWYITDYARKSGGGESAKAAKEKSEAAKEKSESAKETSAGKESKDSSSSSSSTSTASTSTASTDKK